MDKNLNSFASELTEEVYEKWKEFERPIYGFKTFVTPVQKNPPFLIIGYNPGVSKEKNSFQEELLPRFEKGDFSPPREEENEIMNREYKLAKRLKDTVFHSHAGILENSVKYDLFFFRSSSAKGLEKELGEFHDEAKSFCYNKTEEIVEKINPDYILVYGSTTFRKLKENFEGFEEVEEPLKNNRGHKYYRHGIWKGKDVFGIAHPTGPNNESDKNLKEASSRIFEKIEF